MSLRSVLIICAIWLTPAWAQSPPAPGPLTVPSATSKQVQLSWSPSANAKSYSVQRKTDGDYARIPTVPPVITAASVTDSSIDPFATYTYRIIALNDSGQSDPSNEVTVGPPPVGFNLVIPAPPDTSGRPCHFCPIRMTLDSNGDPALAYLDQEPQPGWRWQQ
jgi:hypothetical protein